jgi:DNA-directed RNA polymerase specialized sigma24 family protein
MRSYNSKYQNDILGKAKTSRIPNMGWQDIAQMLDIALWRKLGGFQGRNGASERTFAQRIMRTALMDLGRTANRKKRIIDSNHSSLDELMEKGGNGEAGFDVEDPNWQRVFVRNIQNPTHPVFRD